MPAEQLEPGQRVRVHQEIDRREGNWQNEVVGTIVSIGGEPTGSWHAHGKDGRLWLNRIRLKKDSGELTTITIDQHSRIELLDANNE